MKIFHTADWHLGNTFHGYDRLEEHRHFLSWLETVIEEQQPDALLVSGDIFDNPNPPASAERLLYDFFCNVTEKNKGLQVVIIAGNHDSAYRLEAPTALLRQLGIHVRGHIGHDAEQNVDYKQFLIPIQGRNNPEDKAIVLAMPFLRPNDYQEGETIQQGTIRIIQNLQKAALNEYGQGVPFILMGHFYAIGSEISAEEHSERLVVGGQECINSQGLGNNFAYTALGHIHKVQTVGGQPNVKYAGSALPMSFSEKNYHHGLNVVDINQGHINMDWLAYEPLRKLISVPEKGSADYADILMLLGRLPKGNRTNDNDDWPYLEVQVREMKPDATMANEITKILDGRKARLCRIVRVRPNGEVAENKAQITTTDDLRRLNPAILVRTIYQNVYGEEMPNEIAKLFAVAKRKAEEANEDE